MTWMKSLTLLFLALVISLPTWAKNDTLTPATYKKLDRAQKKFAREDYAGALNTLLPLTQKTRRGTFDHAMTWQLIGHIHAAQELYLKAIDAYEQALTQNALNDTFKRPIMVNLGQLYISESQYQKGITLLTQWLQGNKKINNTTAGMHILIANAYTILQNFDKAIEHARLAIEQHSEPKESWYQMLLGTYYENKQYEHAIGVLETLIGRYPAKKKYWQQLSSLQMLQKQANNALLTLQLAWQKQLLDEEQDLFDLANLYALQGLPHEAATVLHTGLDNKTIQTTFNHWNRVAQLYLMANENTKSIAMMEQALQFSQAGDDFLTLAQLYVADEQWQAAERLLKSALAKRSLTKTIEAKYLYGIVLFEQNKPSQAIDLFEKIKNDPEYGSKAQQWIAFFQAN